MRSTSIGRRVSVSTGMNNSIYSVFMSGSPDRLLYLNDSRYGFGNSVFQANRDADSFFFLFRTKTKFANKITQSVFSFRLSKRGFEWFLYKI